MIKKSSQRLSAMSITQVCTVAVKDLKAAVASAIKPINKKGVEILTHLHCTSTKSGLTLTGYNLHTGVAVTIESMMWREDCKFLIPSLALKRWLAKQSGYCHIYIIETKRGLTINLEGNKSTLELPTLDIEDYPLLPDLDAPIATLEGSAKVLEKAISSCQKFVSKDRFWNPSLAGINFSSFNGIFAIQSTNKHVISRYQTPESLPDFSLTINADSLVLPNKGLVKLNFYAEYLSVESGSTETFIKTVKEPFPPSIAEWQPAINLTLVINKKALLSQLEIAMAYSKDIPVSLHSRGSTLEITGDCIDGEFSITLEATVFSELQTNVSAKYLRDAISFSQREEVTLAFDCNWNETPLIGVIGTTSQFITPIRTVSLTTLQTHQ